MKYSNKDAEHFFKLGTLDIGNNHTIKQFLEAIPIPLFDKLKSKVWAIPISDIAIIEFKDKFDTPYCYYLPISDLTDFMKPIDKHIEHLYNTGQITYNEYNNRNN